MKNIQVIDGADNCTYDIYSISEDKFLILFPNERQNVEFIEDVFKRLGDEFAGNLLADLWGAPCSKSSVEGIHGTLFFQLENKREFYPSKRECDLNETGRGWCHP